jgi:hypothetical protein
MWLLVVGGWWVGLVEALMRKKVGAWEGGACEFNERGTVSRAVGCGRGGTSFALYRTGE